VARWILGVSKLPKLVPQSMYRPIPDPRAVHAREAGGRDLEAPPGLLGHQAVQVSPCISMPLPCERAHQEYASLDRRPGLGGGERRRKAPVVSVAHDLGFNQRVSDVNMQFALRTMLVTHVGELVSDFYVAAIHDVERRHSLHLSRLSQCGQPPHQHGHRMRQQQGIRGGIGTCQAAGARLSPV